MVKHLTKHGNSLALVIDKPILELLRMTEETALEITTDGKRLIVATADAADERKFRAALKKTHERYGRALKRLAE